MDRLTIPDDTGPDLEITGELVAKVEPGDKWNQPTVELYRVDSGGYVVARVNPDGTEPRHKAEHLADDTALVEHFEVDGVVSREGKNLLQAAGLNHLPGVVKKL